MTKNREIPLFDIPCSYPSLLGGEAWSRLHPDIRKRFSPTYAYRSVTYRGVMQLIYLSRAGKLLAQVCRLIGTPLALYAGTDVPIEVKVYPDTALNGMTWDRFYLYPHKKVNRVKSTKCIQKDNRLIEVVGAGFGMYLNTYERNSAIYFESTQYFLQLGGVRIPIPDLLTPGRTTVSQSVRNNGCFEFRLEVVHPLLGLVFKQCGDFREES
ncbi:MAG: DUF4166 domain-containing protein [Gammaproteobacteria bacterium]|nr:DUF4166 domain-containing protein [Gammaproteobacteria bacterium]